MADADLITYESEDEAALNDVYDNLGSEEVESSDGLPTEPEEVEEETEEEESDGDDVDPKNGIFRDPSHDPFEGWHKIAGNISKEIDIKAVLLDDPDVKKVWDNQEDQEETESEEDDYDNGDVDEIFELDDEPIKKRSDDEDEEEEAADPFSTGDESDEREVESTEPPTPHNLIVSDRAESDEEDDEEDQFSLDDIVTDPEDEEEQNDAQEEKVEGVPGEEEHEEEEEDENVKPRQRKLSKVNDSDTTEYETLSEHSENEAVQVEEEVAEEEVFEEEIIEEKPKTPNPYGYTELHTNIDHIEEFDDGFMEKFMRNERPSAGSSDDESDPEKGNFDVEVEYNLKQHNKFSVIKAVRNKNKTEEKQNRRRRVSRCPQGMNTYRKEEEIQKEQSNEHKTKSPNKKKDSRRKTKERYIDLNVYSFPIPKYNSEGEIQQGEVGDQSQGKTQSKKKKQKVKKLKARKKLDESYNRCHDWYKFIPEAPAADYPSSSIPSFKTQWRSMNIQKRTVQLAMDRVLDQTFQAIEDIERIKLRKEATHNSQFLLLQLADEVVGELEEQQQRHAVRYAVEVLLDQWEDHVYQTRKSMVEEQLEKMSELVVKEAISKVSFHVENEDRVASLVVRDALALSMDQLGKNRTKVQNKLHQIFHEHKFEDFDFDRGETVIRQKIHRRRRDLDVFLHKRKGRIKDVLQEKEEDARIKRRRTREEARKKKKEEGQVDNLEEIQEDPNDKEGNEGTTDEEADLARRELIHLAPEHLSDGEEACTGGKVPPSVTKMDGVSKRQRRRSQVLKVWKETDSKVLTDLRKENKEWNNLFDTKKREEEERNAKLNTAADAGDLNAMYADEEKQENEKEPKSDTESVNLDEQQMPNLKVIVEEALNDHQADIMVVPIKQIYKIAPPSEGEEEEQDSAVESGEDEVNSPKRNTQVVEVVAKPPEAVNREDTGFSSILNDELEAHDLENQTSVQDFIHLIPTIDRDQYLNDWLVKGSSQSTGNNARLPTPPSKGRSSSKMTRPRRFHLKRPGTAESAVSIRDVVPLEDRIFSQYRAVSRLNSAKSTRSTNRPESGFSMYSDRSSLHSRLDDRASSVEIESDEEERIAMKSTEGVTQKNTKIEFYEEKSEERSRNGKQQVNEKELETSAWNFYLRQNRELRLLQEKIEKEGKPVRFEDAQLPPSEFLEADMKAILDKYGTVEINGMYDEEEDEVEIELLRLAMSDHDSDDDDDDDDEDAKKKAPSISPPSTPWKRQKNRPMTPDSMDSDEELEKIKKRHYNVYQSNHQGQQQERPYKQYLRKKDTSLPPPPKLGWQPPTNGLIKWKTAAVDVKKTKAKGKGNINDGQVNLHLNRALFNQLQLSMKRSDRQKVVQQNRLLQRRATLHTEEISLTKLEKRKKILPEGAESGSISPRSTRSIPSYARTTKAASLRRNPDKVKEKVKLPKIHDNQKVTKSAKSTKTSHDNQKVAKSAKSTKSSTQKARTSR